MLSFRTDYNHKELMIKSNLKAVFSVVVVLWIVMFVGAMPEMHAPTEYLAGLIGTLVISLLAGMVLFTGLIVTDLMAMSFLHRWWDVNKKRYEQRHTDKR